MSDYSSIMLMTFKPFLFYKMNYKLFNVKYIMKYLKNIFFLSQRKIYLRCRKIYLIS